MEKSKRESDTFAKKEVHTYKKEIRNENRFSDTRIRTYDKKSITLKEQSVNPLGYLAQVLLHIIFHHIYIACSGFVLANNLITLIMSLPMSQHVLDEFFCYKIANFHKIGFTIFFVKRLFGHLV